MDYDFIFLFVLLILSAFFSSSELAFVISNKVKIEIRARQNQLIAKNASFFVERPNVFFSTILISNNIVNIAFASIITVYLTNFFQLSDFWILIITTVSLLFFGEIIPKYFARENADTFVQYSALPLRGIYFLLLPFVKITTSISSLLSANENLTEENYNHLFDRDDLESLLSESVDAGSVDEMESDVIKKIIDLGDQKIYEAMTPRTGIVGIEIESEISEVIKVFSETGYSKLPVYQENLDNIKGLVYSYDLFRNPTQLSEIMRDVIFVPETKKSLEMMNEFSSRGVSIAVVVDEFGGTAGLITVEDIVEEMFGEIHDEYDVDEEVCQQVGENIFIVSGQVEIDYLNEKHNTGLPEGDFETVAGYITSEIGRIPEKGEQIIIDEFLILILRASQTKIDLVKIFKDDPSS